jgi:gluconate 5-dehydrogenase
MFDLTGQVALVTGSSRGIGYAAARALGRQGAVVAINGRDPDALRRAGDALRDQGIAVHVVPFDVTDVAAAERAIDTLIGITGRLDIYFANAGVQHRAPLLSFPQAEFERIIFANLTAQWALGRHVAAGMAARGYGRILFTGSLSALLGRKEITAYSAAKAAIHGMVRQWATELSGSGVTVNAVAPGYIRTELTRNLWSDDEYNRWLESRVPQGKWGVPDDVVAAVVFLAAREAGYVTGQVLVVDGGMASAM